MKDNVKQYSGQQVFEMVWAVLDAVDRARRDASPAVVVIPNNVIADAVRLELEEGVSPVGLRAEVQPDGHGGGRLGWYSYNSST